MPQPFALGLYSVRTLFREDLEACIRRVAALGYRGVEFFGPPIHPADRVTSILAETGLALVGWHIRIDLLEGDALAETMAYCRAVGCPRAIVPWMPPETFAARETVLAFAERMEAIRIRMEGYGIQLGYHNHAVEFNPLPDGTLPWALLMDNTRIIGQLDSGNALLGSADGLDAAQLVARWPGRAVTVHLKPWSQKAGSKTMIGDDDIDWPAFLSAAKEQGGAEWLIVEYEEELLYEEFEGVEKCLDALNALA